MQKICPISLETQLHICEVVINLADRFRDAQLQCAEIYKNCSLFPKSSMAVSRDFSEQIEQEIAHKINCFDKGIGFADLQCDSQQWEVKVQKVKGKTTQPAFIINQATTINRENYIIVNFKEDMKRLEHVWLLIGAQDNFFTEKKANLNLRQFVRNQISHKSVIMLIENGLWTPTIEKEILKKPRNKKYNPPKGIASLFV